MGPYPKRREDLRFSDQTIGGEKVYIIVDDETDQYYRFPEVEFGIFWDLDGQTSLEDLKAKIEKQLDAELPMDQLEGFVNDLARKGLLEGAEPGPKKKKPVNTLANAFYLRFKAFNPDRMLNAIHDPLSFAFRRPFVIFGLIIITISVLYSLVHSREWIHDARGLFHGAGLIVLYLSLLVVGFVHETGHALTCKHYGGKVKEMGFMLIYFQPAFYANVSDAYLFKDKYQKAAVGAAGLFFQFIFAAFATVLWYLSIPGSLLATATIGAIGMSGFTALWNLNPLIKLDGYYVLNDLLEVTNLRANSFSYVGLWLKRWIWGFPEFQEELNRIPARLKKIYLGYGTAGFCYTFFFFGIFLLFILNYIISLFELFGVLLIGAGILLGLLKLYSKARKGFLEIRKKAGGDADLKLIYDKRMKVFAAIGAFLVVLAVIPVRWGIRGICEVRPEVKRPLSPLEAGVIVKVLKTGGESVQKGETIAVLDDFHLERELDDLRLQKQVKEDQIALMKAEYGSSLAQAEGNFAQSKIALSAQRQLSPHQILEAKNAMLAAEGRYHKAQTAVSLAKKETDRYQELAKEELASPKDTEEKQAAYQAAEEEWVSAKDDYEAQEEAYQRILRQATVTDPEKLQADLINSQQTLRYTQKEQVQVQVAQSELDEINANIKTDEDKIERSRIRSPIDGLIMNSRLKEFEGKMVGEGQAIGWVYQPGPMIFTIAVSELDVAEVPRRDLGDDGDDVTIKMVAIPGRSFHGHVTKVIPESLVSRAGKAYLVDVSVDDKDNVLLPGMQGTAKIYGKRRSLLWQLIRRPAQYVFWKLWSLF